MWLKQTEQPGQPKQAPAEPAASPGLVGKLGLIKDQVRSKISTLGKRSSPKGARVRKVT